jgi:hypothetical protein
MAMAAMRRRVLFQIALVVLGASCLSPTIPLPPPDKPDSITPLSTPGEWSIAGNCIKGALVNVINKRTHEGAVFIDEEETARYSVQIEGAECDSMYVTQEIYNDDGELEKSAQTAFILPGDACP